MKPAPTLNSPGDERRRGAKKPWSVPIYSGGYPSEDREAWLKANGFRDQIQRKGARNKPLSECQQRRNQRIARTRARVEHPFAAIAQMGGKLIRTIGQARASFAMTMMAACYNLKRLVYFQEAGIKAL